MYNVINKVQKLKGDNIMKNNLIAKRIKSTAHVLRIFTLICFWASLAAAVLTAGVAIVLQIFSNSNTFTASDYQKIPFLTSGSSIDIGNTLRVNLSELPGADMIHVIIALMITVSICGFIMLPFFKQLSLMLKSTENGLPFAAENAKRLSVMGIAIIVMSVVYRIGEYITMQSVLKTINAQGMTAQLGIDTTGILMGVLLLILAGIFKYGSYLQEEYDTTL